MITATTSDKDLIIDILSESFDTNQSVNFVVKQDRRRKERIRRLMEYSYELCSMFGKVYLSEDKKACALVLFHERKRTTLKTVLLDLKLTFSCIGLTRVKQVLDKEAKVRSNYPPGPIYYIWFIGVHPSAQKKGIGKRLLADIISESSAMQRPVYLETSAAVNVDFYKYMGFEVYKELEQPYKLYLIRKELNII